MSCHVLGQSVSDLCSAKNIAIESLHENSYANLLLDLEKDTGRKVKIVKNGNSYIQQSTSVLGEGAFGYVYKADLVNDTNENDVISIAFKEMRNLPLDEIKALEKHGPLLMDICPHIIPSKVIGDRVYMPLGDGDLGVFENKMSFESADQVVSCIQKTLLCLQHHGVFYFDLKPHNIVFKCKGNSLIVWLADIGSVIPDDFNDYGTTIPHPFLVTENVPPYLISDDIYKNDDKVRSFYAFSLTMLFCYLTFDVEMPYFHQSDEQKLDKIHNMFHLCKSNNECTERYSKYLHVLAELAIHNKSSHLGFWEYKKADLTHSTQLQQHAESPPKKVEALHKHSPMKASITPTEKGTPSASIDGCPWNDAIHFQVNVPTEVVLRKRMSDNAKNSSNLWIKSKTILCGIPVDSTWVNVYVPNVGVGYIKAKYLKMLENQDPKHTLETHSLIQQASVDGMETYKINVPSKVLLRTQMNNTIPKEGKNWIQAGTIVYGNVIDSIWVYVFVPEIGYGYIKSKYLQHVP